ncbi:MAG: hypothetical protein J4O04_04520 [Chloroflexi bacterium]|nr:hypothetical protein [Chloroflexota bacterium]
MAKKRQSQRRAGILPNQKVEIDFVLLGDFAQASNGKLTVVGAGWNIWNTPKYPNDLPFGLGIGFLVPWNETNRKHKFTFKIAASEGDTLVEGGGEFEIGRKTGIPPGMIQRVVIGLSGQLKIESSGTYEILVTCAGQRKTVTFEALPVQLPQLSVGQQ